MEPFFSSKSGPNGPHVLVRAHLDASAVKEEKLDTLIKAYIDHVHPKDSFLKGDLDTMADLGQKVITTKPISSRIHFLAEGGCKTRTIAICDYWSQQALKGLHDFLMELLSRLSTDGTYSHGDAATFVKGCTLLKKRSYCFDLSNATDRFPVKLQEDVLGHFIGREAAST